MNICLILILHFRRKPYETSKGEQSAQRKRNATWRNIKSRLILPTDDDARNAICFEGALGTHAKASLDDSAEHDA